MCFACACREPFFQSTDKHRPAHNASFRGGARCVERATIEARETVLVQVQFLNCTLRFFPSIHSRRMEAE